MRVFLAGGGGAIGRFLVPRLLEAGHEVHALARGEASARRLGGAGAKVVRGDALDRDGVIEAVRNVGPDAIVHQLTSIPDRINPRRMAKQFEGTNRLRTEGTRILADAARAAGVRRFVAQSIAFAYEPAGSVVKDEDAPLNLGAPAQFRPIAQAVASLEQTVREVDGAVLRYGQFYGPATAFAADGGIAHEVRARRFPIVGEGGGCFSFVHLDDAAAATVAALEIEGPAILNVVDDEPAALREWLPHYARVLGAKPPRKVPAWIARIASGAYGVEFMTRLRGASNARAKSLLGWQPARASWRTGFEEMLAGS